MAANPPPSSFLRALCPLTSLRGLTVLYGGSFDPPHLGHQMACLQLLEGFGALAVWVVPTGQHAFGKASAPAAQRLHMAQLMVRPFGRRARVLDVEQRLPPPSRTTRTVAALRRRYPHRRFALAVGADLWDELPRWEGASDLLASTPLVLLGRAGAPRPAQAPDPYLELPAVASRDVRARVREQRSVAGLVPRAVAEYIATQRLYGAPAG